MGLRRVWGICILLLMVSRLLLGSGDTHRSIEEMLAYHVEFKEFSPLLAKRCFKILFTQFDPYKVYLLPQEHTLFTDMTEKTANYVVYSHHLGAYPLFEEARELIQSAIMRARSCRTSLYKQFLQDGIDLASPEIEQASLPQTEEALQERMRLYLLRHIRAEKEWEGIQELSLKDIERISSLLERRFMEGEERYLRSGKEDLSFYILKAFAKSLDAHTSFFSAEEAYELRTNLEKQFEGVGLVLREGIRGIVIKEILTGSPADLAGNLSPGDLLVSVDGWSVSSGSYKETMERLKGKKGSLVSLLVQKKTGEQVCVPLQRETLLVEKEMVHFSSIPYGNGIIGVLEVPSFYENGEGTSCEKDIKEALRVLKNRGKLLGVILDMRRNSGGFLSQAVKVTGLFVSSGVIVISKYAQGQMQYLRDIDGRVFFDGPLVVLTSKMSASATEIVSQALQDYGIALVIGDERTYGKGTIQYQTVTDTKASSYFKVTIGRYYTVSGRSTQIEGVKADIVVPTVYSPFNIGEKYLSYPLKNDQVNAAFIDSLDDVEASKKAWLRKNYLPHIQKRLSFWTEMLPILQINSQSRLKGNKGFLDFLTSLEQRSIRDIQENSSHLQKEDFPLDEAIHILKDMALLQKYRESSGPVRK